MGKSGQAVFDDLEDIFIEKPGPEVEKRYRKALAQGGRLDKANAEGLTPLRQVASSYQGSVAIFDLLVKLGADLQETGRDGQNLLHTAAGCGNKELVARLLKLGLDPMARDKAGQTAVELAWLSKEGSAAVPPLVKAMAKQPPPTRRDGDLPGAAFLTALRAQKDLRGAFEAAQGYFATRASGDPLALLTAASDSYWVRPALGTLLAIREAHPKAPALRLARGKKAPEFHAGDVHVAGDLEVKSSLFVAGDLTVTGVVSFLGDDGAKLLVGGDLRARALLGKGRRDYNELGVRVGVGGDLEVSELLYCGNDCEIQVDGEARADLIVQDGCAEVKARKKHGQRPKDDELKDLLAPGLVKGDDLDFGKTVKHLSSGASARRVVKDAKQAVALAQSALERELDRAFGPDPDDWKRERPAIEKGIRKAVADGASVNVRPKDWSISLLRRTVRRENTYVIELLIELGADPLERDKDGRTLAHEAAGCGAAASLVVLEKQGVDLAAKDKKGRTPLDEARNADGIRSDDKKRVIELLKRKTSVAAPPRPKGGTLTIADRLRAARV